MIYIKFTGKVQCGDGNRSDNDPEEPRGSIHIGKYDIISILSAVVSCNKNYRAFINNNLYGEGMLYAIEGYGYSEMTWMSDELYFLKGHTRTDLIQHLEHFEGEEISFEVQELGT